jgi:hypothetical protein
VNFTALMQAVADSGFDDLSTGTTGQLAQLVNDALVWVDELLPWPYREQTQTGTVPMAIADLGEVDTVVDATTNLPLDPISRGELIGWGADLTLPGAPTYWYRDTLTGTLKVSTYPLAPGNITVRHYRQAATLTNGADIPGAGGLCGAPARWHSVYVAVARREAYRRYRGDMASANGEQAMILGDLQRMIDSLCPDVGRVEIPLVGDDS